MKRNYNPKFYYNFNIEKAIKNIYSCPDGSSPGSLGLTIIATKQDGEIIWWSIPKFFYPYPWEMYKKSKKTKYESYSTGWMDTIY